MKTIIYISFCALLMVALGVTAGAHSNSLYPTAEFLTPAGQIVLPSTGDTTGVAWGDGDTVLYESTDDNLSLDIGGPTRWNITETVLQSATTSGPSMRNEAASATNPVFTVEGDGNTGIGFAAADEVSIIPGATEGLTITEGDNAAGEILQRWGACTFANLGTPADGHFCYCSNCTKGTPCAGSGNGALAKRLNGAWDCD